MSNRIFSDNVTMSDLPCMNCKIDIRMILYLIMIIIIWQASEWRWARELATMVSHRKIIQIFKPKLVNIITSLNGFYCSYFPNGTAFMNTDFSIKLSRTSNMHKHSGNTKKRFVGGICDSCGKTPPCLRWMFPELQNNSRGRRRGSADRHSGPGEARSQARRRNSISSGLSKNRVELSTFTHSYKKVVGIDSEVSLQCFSSD